MSANLVYAAGLATVAAGIALAWLRLFPNVIHMLYSDPPPEGVSRYTGFYGGLMSLFVGLLIGMAVFNLINAITAGGA